MAYILRASSEEDYEFCYKITKQNMHDLFYRHWGGWIDSKFIEGFVLENIRIIVVDDQKVGFLSCKMDEDPYYIDNIQISSEFQRQGIGSTVLQNFMSEHHDSLIRLTTFEDNPATQLYERLGFQVVKQEGATLLMERKV